MARDVLIVDDDRTALSNFGNDVSLNLNIEPFLASDPEQALQILRDFPIKVLVTDQRMEPSMSGIELARKTKDELGLDIPIIMLSGKADRASVIDAMNMGFFQYVDKDSASSQLVPSIRQAIQKYENDVRSRSVVQLDRVLARRRWLNIAGPQVTLRLVRISSIVDPVVHDTEWQTVMVAQRGMEVTREVTITRSSSVTYESSSAQEVLTKAGLKVGKLVGEVEAALEGKIQQELKLSKLHAVTVEVKHTITAKDITDPPTVSGSTLQSRNYQHAPVYTRVNCVLQLDCTCCDVPRKFDVSLDLPTSRIALRQVQYYDRGQPLTIHTGIIPGNLIPDL
ncbi:MAG TPA: response regulator [Chloroflexia bacterium]|jgi:DNA-binding response OmpR family regulator